ncbi:PBSX family phage terminase large subunit [Ignavibacteriales bacterium]
MSRDIKIINPFVPKFFPLLQDKKRNLVMMGGGGSGKSHFAAQKILYRALNEKPIDGRFHRFLIVRKVAKTLRNTVYETLKVKARELQIYDYFRFIDSLLEVRCVNGNKLILSGLDDVEKIKSIEGITGIWIEEATELTKGDYLQLNTRLRGKTPYYKQIITTFNPINPFHWLKDYFFDNISPDRLRRTTTIRSNHLDNPFLDDEYRMELLSYKDIDYNFYVVYTLGNWGSAKGIIYDPFQTDVPYPKNFDEIIFGIDFGYNNPTALVQIGIKDRACYLKELLYETKLTNSDIVTRLEALNIPKYAEIYGDPAEPDKIEDIFRAGYNIKPAVKSVKSGIDFVKRLKLFSNSGNININKEVNTYKWKEDKDERLLEEPVKLYDHTMDAIRYALFTHLKDRISERDLKSFDKSLNEQTIKIYCEGYMELKYKYLQKQLTDSEYLPIIQEDLSLSPEDFRKILAYAKENYNY